MIQKPFFVCISHGQDLLNTIKTRDKIFTIWAFSDERRKETNTKDEISSAEKFNERPSKHKESVVVIETGNCALEIERLFIQSEVSNTSLTNILVDWNIVHLVRVSWRINLQSTIEAKTR